MRSNISIDFTQRIGDRHHMAKKSKLDRAVELALETFEQLPVEEQKIRLKAIRQLKFRRNRSTPTLRSKRRSHASSPATRVGARTRTDL